ncbi:MAG: HEAT repeat domain-containing protein, partial [Gemmataceae bacterium]|nr:HEAT repeat domain-containing protein [Gemmataceae bacterium]
MNRAWVVVAGLAAGLSGCVGQQTDKVQTRSQAGEDPAGDPDAPPTVASKTEVDDTRPVHVSGVGLVYGLEPGAGSHPPAGGYRGMLEQSFRRKGFTNLRELLDDPANRTSLVLVSALVPPGARKDDPIDLQITLPPDSRTSSLRGGYLYACELTEYDTTGNLSSLAKTGKPGGMGGELKLGDVWVRTLDKVPVVAGAEVNPADAKPADGPPSLRAGRAWAGGKVTRPRPYMFVMNRADANMRTAAGVAERLNVTFGGSDAAGKVAEAKTRDVVWVHVPFAYRHDHRRFLLVARQVPMDQVGTDSLYRRRLEDELLDPATAVPAAVKLEALGGDAKRPLRVALESPSPWVQFAAATSLAYLGHSDGAGVLARLAEDHPALRAHCLLALASSDDAAFTDKLAELMGSPDPEMRYGAFIALRLANDGHPAVAGRPLNHALWVHPVARGSAGMVHLATGGRSELVVFGDNVRVRGPLPTFAIGTDFTVGMPAGAAGVELTRIVKVNDEWVEKKETSPPELTAVLALLARLGGGHPEAVALVRGLAAAEAVTAAVAVDAIPRQMTLKQLAALAPKDPTLSRANAEVARVGTVRAELEGVALDLAEAEAEPKPADAAPRTPLSRDPGRLFGPKRPPEPAGVGEPL